MRGAFFETIMELGSADPRVCLVVGDLGFGVVEAFARKLPAQFLNAGVAEQNMTGLAAGMAMAGKIVFTYSIANFPTIRCLEQIRNDVCYHEANVKIVAVGGGFAYGSLGMTHHATEDIAIMRALPEMVVVAPGDPLEARAATRALAEHQGPAYLRLGRAGEPAVHASMPDFQVGRAIEVCDGDELTIISTGAMLHTCLQVAERMQRQGTSVRLLSMHTVKPLDADAVLAAARETSAIVTVEEHSILGGLGGAVAEVLAEADGHCAFKRFGLPSKFSSIVGSQEYQREKYGLDPENLFQGLMAFLKKNRASARA